MKIAVKHFGLSTSSFSNMFTTLVNFLAYELEEMSAAVTTNMPSMGAPCFRDFPVTRSRMVIECTDIFAERPSGLSVSHQKFRSYKHHITIKFMVGCSMNGRINFCRRHLHSHFPSSTHVIFQMHSFSHT